MLALLCLAGRPPWFHVCPPPPPPLLFCLKER